MKVKRNFQKDDISGLLFLIVYVNKRKVVCVSCHRRIIDSYGNEDYDMCIQVVINCAWLKRVSILIFIDYRLSKP